MKSTEWSIETAMLVLKRVYWRLSGPVSGTTPHECAVYMQELVIAVSIGHGNKREAALQFKIHRTKTASKNLNKKGRVTFKLHRPIALS